MAKKEKKEKFVISSDQIRKMNRKAKRDIDLESGNFIRTGAHKTAKKDIEERSSGVLRSQEIEEIIKEELAELNEVLFEEKYDDN
jgi:hypothetical protein